jgi:dTDP-4-dehydrorhamnose 3,5-epimerase
MGVRVESRQLGDIVVVVSDVFRDERGFFKETYRADQFRELGLPQEFVQDNHSGSVRGVLRGLHFQWEPPMGKLMRVTRGAAFLVAVDVRKDSPTLGQWYGREVTAEDGVQIYAPAGFARGFCVLSDYAEIQYKCTGIYNSRGEGGIRWDDPELGIAWPLRDVLVSEKDKRAPMLAEWLARPEAEFFPYSELAYAQPAYSPSGGSL